MHNKLRQTVECDGTEVGHIVVGAAITDIARDRFGKIAVPADAKVHHIDSVWVDPKYRRRGFGQQLYLKAFMCFPIGTLFHIILQPDIYASLAGLEAQGSIAITVQDNHAICQWLGKQDNSRKMVYTVYGYVITSEGKPRRSSVQVSAVSAKQAALKAAAGGNRVALNLYAIKVLHGEEVTPMGASGLTELGVKIPNELQMVLRRSH
jgi:GNAT superfamily N-acetyltransferase